jgi:threonine/homoserine/homoserine lactone efflux protein
MFLYHQSLTKILCICEFVLILFVASVWSWMTAGFRLPLISFPRIGRFLTRARGVFLALGAKIRYNKEKSTVC